MDSQPLVGSPRHAQRLAHALLEADAVVKARERIVNGEIVDAFARLLMLESDRAEVHAGRHDLPLEERRPPRLGKIEGEGPEDGPRLDLIGLDQQARRPKGRASDL